MSAKLLNKFLTRPLPGVSLPTFRWEFTTSSSRKPTVNVCCSARKDHQPTSSIPWQKPPPPGAPPVPPLQGPPAAASQPTRRDLVGYTAVIENTKRRKAASVLGTVTEVLEVSDTGAAHPLLRIVVPASLPAAGPPLLPPSPDNPLPSSGDASASLDDPSEEHLVPLVRSIVPRIDPGTRTLHVQPPEGLLDLGRRRALVERIRLQLEPLLSNSPTPERAPLMPTRRQLMEAGRHDLVRQIASAGGFLEVAQALGYRSVRKPPGYWEDEDALDRELSLFVAANWIQFEDDSEGDSEGEGDGEGSWLEADDKADFFGQVLGSHAQQEKAQWAGTSDQSAKPRQKEVYWYNQVTRRVQWSEPDVPEFVPLDDEGSVLLTEAPEDRAMPSRRTLLAAGRYDLHAAIMSAGGYTQVAEDLDRWPAWPPTRHLRGFRALRSALRDFIVEHRLPAKRIPTSKQLSSLGRLDLHQAIVHMGGYRAVATRLKWQSQRRPKGQFQDLDAVVGEIMKFATEEAGKGGGVVRMPTHGELRAAGRHDLRHALQLHGSKAVAEAAGLEMSRQGGRSRGRKGWVEALAAEVPVEKQEEGLSAGHG